MKPKHTTLSITLILLLLALFSACNADASAGLFRQISESRAPIGIVYKQLLGTNTTNDTLFYETDKGLFSSTGAVREQLKSGVEGNLIQYSFYDSTNNFLLFTTNDGTRTVKILNVATKTMVTPSLDLTTHSAANLRYSRIYASGFTLLQDTNGAFVLLKYDASAKDYVVSTHTLPADTSNYDKVSVHHLTGFENKAVSVSTPIIISLVRNDGSRDHYRHFYYNATGNPVELPSSTFQKIRIAGFTVSNSTLYILSENGKLFGGVAGGSFTEMIDVSDDYQEGSFIYSVSGTTTTHVVTKPTAKNSMLVFSFTNGSTSKSVSTANIKSGYAEYIDTTEIVSSLNLGSGASSDTLLVATNDNGLYKIAISHDNANIDSIANGESTESEEYDFIPVP
ncbi:MAG: hypothetical protein EOM32_05445 [Spirochaetia bacterium]|nr:hypothetical protein [Spirochaetia bacterium]NCC90056.1 hypothetical protein [Spirochaetia bacterium]